MKVLLFGATGMVGQGVLRECVADRSVDEIVAVVREPLRAPAAKVREERRRDFYAWPDAETLFAGVDACFFCLGVSAVGRSEAEYRHVTYDLALAVAEALVMVSPQAVFVYVSGAGTNAQGRAMWARVKGETENALLALPFNAVYCFRPGYIQPLHGVRSKVGWYNGLYRGLSWLYPLLRRLGPGVATSTEGVGRAMLRVVEDGWQARVLGNAEINEAAAMPSRLG